VTRRTAVLNPVATARIAELVATLRERDTDPAYSTAPRLDTYARISPSADPTAVKVERQTTDVLEMLLRGNYRLGETLIDWNLSAWKPRGKRPAFLSGLARVASGESNGIAAWNSDRLTRQLSEAEQLIAVATVNRAVFLSYSGEFDLSTSDGRMMLRLQTMFAQQESDRKSERLARKYAAQREGEGRSDGLGGYQSTDVFGHGGRDEATLTAERDAIAWAIPEVTNGATWQAVADEWNRRGLSSRGGQRFNVTKVSTILQQPRHAGYLTLGDHGSRTIVGEAHNAVAIVDKATWSRFTAVLASRAERSGGRPAGTTQTHLLGGLLRCAECGNTLLVSGPSYRCNGAVGCRRVTVNAAVLDAVVGEYVVETLSDPRNGHRIAARNSERGRIEVELERVRERKRRFTALYQAGSLDDDEYVRVTTDNATMVRELESRRDALTDDGQPARVHSRDEAEREWDKSEGNREERRELVLSAFPLGIAVRLPTVARVRSNAANTRDRLSRILPGWLEGITAQRAATAVAA